MPGFTLLDIDRDRVPLTPVPVTLTNQASRHGANHPWIHAAEPTCWKMTNGQPQQTLETGPLAHLAERHGHRFGLEPVRLCERCDDPTYARHRREVLGVVNDTADWRQLRYLLFAAEREQHPSPAKLGLVVEYLLRVRRDLAETGSAAVEAFLRDRLEESYVTARTLRDIAVAADPSSTDVTSGPWVGVGVRDLELAWRNSAARGFLAAAPGNIFDTPVAAEHATGGSVGAVLALPPDRAAPWAQANTGVVEVTDVAITSDLIPHLGLATRLWTQTPDLDLATAIELAAGIACPAGR